MDRPMNMRLSVSIEWEDGTTVRLTDGKPLAYTEELLIEAVGRAFDGDPPFPWYRRANADDVSRVVREAVREAIRELKQETVKVVTQLPGVTS